MCGILAAIIAECPDVLHRCDIPVVIMGETGCGKTRLIRYMCDLARGGRDLKNMLILKVPCMYTCSSWSVVNHKT